MANVYTYTISASTFKERCPICNVVGTLCGVKYATPYASAYLCGVTPLHICIQSYWRTLAGMHKHTQRMAHKYNKHNHTIVHILMPAHAYPATSQQHTQISVHQYMCVMLHVPHTMCPMRRPSCGTVHASAPTAGGTVAPPPYTHTCMRTHMHTYTRSRKCMHTVVPAHR